MCESDSPSQERGGTTSAQCDEIDAVDECGADIAGGAEAASGADDATLSDAAVADVVSTAGAELAALDDYERGQALAAACDRVASEARAGEVSEASLAALHVAVTEGVGDLADRTDGVEATVARELFELLGVIGEI
ncbi:hypothetical protein RYH80_11680 [Halobaculum sp. MBLA0147]|uniref:hypothetical protein n=1 Tax=Halobaculum sp. MBLA0147 TaxID=3079934 RepID=UPI003523E773